MKVSLPLRLATLATVALASWSPGNPATASSFDEKAIDPTQVIAIARPYGENKYDLLVIEQIPGKQQCWSESGSNPTVVDPLLLNYDFTGICRRSTDSNGYSIRLDGQDYGLDYLLSLVRRDGELVLVGMPRRPGATEIVVGRTQGMGSGFLKIVLDPGWRFTKRTYQGKELGHFYFSAQQADLAGGSSTASASSTPSAASSSSRFRDIDRDIYQSEIERAVALGFIAGFKEDNTFRPTTPLTREQLVSITLEALKTLPNSKIQVPATTAAAPYADVAPSRWSAAKIQWAKENEIVKGYPDGSFKPTQAVTRAELVAVLSQAAEYGKSRGGAASTLTGKVAFSDTAGHWSQSLVEQMSARCRVASPVNETGDRFAPDSPALRNYAAAATLRMLECLKSGS